MCVEVIQVKMVRCNRGSSGLYCLGLDCISLYINTCIVGSSVSIFKIYNTPLTWKQKVGLVLAHFTVMLFG